MTTKVAKMSSRGAPNPIADINIWQCPGNPDFPVPQGKQNMCFVVFWGPAVVPLDAYRKVMQIAGVILARALMGSRFATSPPPYQDICAEGCYFEHGAAG